MFGLYHFVVLCAIMSCDHLHIHGFGSLTNYCELYTIHTKYTVYYTQTIP